MIVHDVEQRSPEWSALRCGRPTASDFNRLITSSGKPSSSLSDYAATLAAELYAGRQLEAWQGSQWTERGIELEPEARSHYEFVNGVEVRQVGFVTDGEAGCSPDGFVGDDGMVEFKCLSPWNHVQAYAYWRRSGDIFSTYVAQVQGQLLLCRRKWVDLVFYHPDLPSFTARILPDKQFHAALVGQLRTCIAERNELVELLRTA